jgi:glycosyltransferase involved in cell wall biosynthesis
VEKPLVSIVINNYNYAAYLAEAIDSALGQEYPACEVIVVDDGSQDGSVDIIKSYGERIRPVLKENGGQSSALNAGYACASGEVVIFLDADDILKPHAAGRVAEAFARHPDLARVQYRMEVIDGQGRPSGATKPALHVPVPNGDIRGMTLSFPFDVAWLPTSGNAFAAHTLLQTMPIPEEYGHINADYYLVHTAPLYGTVLFIDEVLACYRVHGANNFEVESGLDLDRLRSTIVYDEMTYRWIAHRAREAGLDGVPEGNRSLSTAASRLVSLRLEPHAHPIPGDRPLDLVGLGLRAALGRTDTSPPARAMYAAWVLAAGLAPRRAARRLAEWFFLPEKRPGINRILRQMHERQQKRRGGG